MAGGIVSKRIMRDQVFMQKALQLARRAYNAKEVPIGAVVVSTSGSVIGQGYNQTEQCYSQSRHAEVIAIEDAGKAMSDWRLIGCTLYVTIQPCLMCIGLICLSRVSRLVYGAESPLFGCSLDKEGLPYLYQKHIRGITGGILAEESQQLVEQFFKIQRK